MIVRFLRKAADVAFEESGAYGFVINQPSGCRETGKIKRILEKASSEGIRRCDATRYDAIC